jgi:hypothetical protein
MADELVIDKPEVKEPVIQSFDGSDTPPEENKVEQIVDKKETKIVEEKKEDPIEDGRNFLKEKLGYDNWDSAKNEIETLKKKEPTTIPIKYENEVSELIHKALQEGKTEEVYSVLDKQIRLGKLTSGEITKSNAPDIIKAAMAEKYKGLTSEQVNYKFNKQFSVPPKPKEDSFETTELYEAAQSEWKERVADNEMEMMIEANLARPELEKLKADLKLPQIAISQPLPKDPTPEELEAVIKYREAFLQNADAALKKFEGFNVTYKDKDVEIKSNYALSNDEKSNVLAKMKTLSEKNYDSNALFAERWVNEDQTFNFDQMAKDLAALETEDSRSQKFVGDSYAKAKLQFLKDKHQIDLGGGGNGELQLEDKDLQKKKEDAIWN